MAVPASRRADSEFRLKKFFFLTTVYSRTIDFPCRDNQNWQHNCVSNLALSAPFSFFEFEGPESQTCKQKATNISEFTKGSLKSAFLRFLPSSSSCLASKTQVILLVLFYHTFTKKTQFLDEKSDSQVTPNNYEIFEQFIQNMCFWGSWRRPRSPPELEKGNRFRAWKTIGFSIKTMILNEPLLKISFFKPFPSSKRK